ncbi:MAG: winged helix-turn-helix transcriptional regulator [Thermoplasmata archaeon]
MGKYIRYGLGKVTPAIITLFFIFIIFNGTVSAEDASILGTVQDNTNKEPIMDAAVLVSFSDNGTMVALTSTNNSGGFQVSGLSPDLYIVTVDALGYHNRSEEVELEEGQSHELTFFLIQYLYDTDGDGIPDSDNLGDVHGEPEEAFGAFSLCYTTGLILTIVLVISLVMYSKIKRENLLKNAVRKRIFHHIKENPGKHYRAILSDLDLSMGVLTYHLNRLEKAQYIKSRQDGMFRRFYPPGPRTEMRFFLSDIQESILSVIKENKGISQSKIADRVGVSRKVVNYHVNILDQAGLILVESHGRESACYFVDSKTDAVVAQ